MTSQHDEATGVQLIRDFELDAKTSRLSCTQTIMNVSSETKEWCHWSRTFALGVGICVIPLAGQSRFPNKYVMYEGGALINARPIDPIIRMFAPETDFLVQAGAPPGLARFDGPRNYAEQRIRIE